MKVYVVMSNDFPAAVFSTKRAAEDYCAAQRAKELQERPIYWRVYTFDLQGI